MSAWWAAASTLVIVWWCARGLGVGRRERSAMVACLVGVALWTVLEWRAPALGPATALRLDTLALGDGSCHLVRSGDGAVLVDCGSRWTGAGVRAIPDALRTLGVRRLDRVIVTHPDIDHYACLPDVAQRVPVGELIIGVRFAQQAQERPDGPAAAFLALMRQRGVPIRTAGMGDAWTLGGASVEVLAPPDGALFEGDNDHALALRIAVDTDAGTRTLLLTGDLEDEGIAALHGAHPDLRADIVEAPHHGSNNEAAAGFVASLSPRVVVQSTGPTRIDPPAWSDVRARALWWTTAVDGSAGVIVRRSGAIEARATSGVSTRREQRPAR